MSRTIMKSSLIMSLRATKGDNGNIMFVCVESCMLEELESLAREIWQEHFTPIIGVEQVEYMLLKFQSQKAFYDQLCAGYRYFFIMRGEEKIGYFGIDTDGGRMFLSKLYIKKENRGLGFAAKTFEFLEEMCEKEGLGTIWLTVNRENTGAIEVYLKKGFKHIDAQKKDIGGGFFMDDHIMEKSLTDKN